MEGILFFQIFVYNVRDKIKIYFVLFFSKLACSIILILLFFPSAILAVDNYETAQATVSVFDPAGPTVNFIGIPEKRVPNISPYQVYNYSADLLVRIYLLGADRTNPDNIIFSTTLNTNDSGSSFMVIPGLPYGQYDITVKSNTTLSKVYSNATVGGYSDVDFTNNASSPLLCGDINLTFGDDKVNSLDLSILVNQWGSADDRADLNKDGLVNSLDISNLLVNFNRVGE